MKIISIHVQSFGKLNDVTLQLNDGVNVIQNVNGFGKTTMASFIRAMLYGFSYRTVGGVKDSARFAPWQGVGRFGGSMTVEHEGTVYRIERFFGATAKSETLTVTNDKTGKSVDLQNMQPGEFLLGLTADSYDRSAYFPQEAVELSSNDNFDSRLANLIQNGAEDFDDVVKKLTARKKTFRLERGSGGKIYELERKQSELLQRLNDGQRAERRAAEIEKTLVEIEAQKQALLTQQHQQKLRQATLQREVAQAQPSPEQQRAATRLAELNEKIRRIPSEFDEDFKRSEEIANEIANLKDEPTTKRSRLVSICSGIVAFVGVLLSIFSATQVLSKSFFYCGIALIVAGVGGIVFDIFKGRKLSGKTNVADRKNELISQYTAIAKKYVFVDGVDYETVKRNLWQEHLNYQADVRVRNELSSTVAAQPTNSQKAENELRSVNEALSDVERQLNGLAMQVGQLTTERKGLTLDTVSVQDELLTVAEQIQQAEFEHKVCETVISLLTVAKDNLSSGYLPKLATRCGELLCQITNSAYQVVVDRTFNVKIREQGQTREMHEFSRGIREITLLCFRIALSELLYDGAIPFIIIDDAFVNFDEDNFLRATDLLKQLAKHAQVVYFTCHKRMGDLLK